MWPNLRIKAKQMHPVVSHDELLKEALYGRVVQECELCVGGTLLSI